MQKNGYERYLIDDYSSNKNAAETSTYSYYKKKKRRGIGCAGLFVVAVLLIGACIILSQTSEREYEFYFVQADEFLNYKEASSISVELQSKQGAGYIYYDGTYHVLISFYPSEDDAKSVVTNIADDYPNASVYTMTATKFKKSKSYSTSENEAIEDCITDTYTLIKRVYNNLLSYDKSEINANVLQVNLKNIYTEFEKNFENFKKNMKNNAKYAIYFKNLTEINECYENLYQISKTSFEAYELKYELAKLVGCYVSFLSCL